MPEKPEQVKKHIADLEEFERKYGEYIRVLEAEWSASLGAPEDETGEPDSSADDWTRLTREVKMLATRAGRAIKASGVAPVGSSELPTIAFDFEVNHGYFSDDGLSVPREILERIPSQISGLEIRLEAAEAAEEEGTMRLLGELIEEGQEQERQRRVRREEQATKAAPGQPWEHPGGKHPKSPWYERPLAVGIIGGLITTVVGGLILAVVLGAFH